MSQHAPGRLRLQDVRRIGVTDIATWLGRQLDEDAMWAREASRDRHGDVPTGSHWQWVNNHDDRVLTPDPAAEEWLDEDSEAGQPALRSVEEFDAGSYELPQFPIHNAEEILTVVAGHIVRHDPASVLRDVAAKRKILVAHWDGHGCPTCLIEMDADEDTDGNQHQYPVMHWTTPCPTTRWLAAAYDGRPGYKDEWRP